MVSVNAKWSACASLISCFGRYIYTRIDIELAIIHVTHSVYAYTQVCSCVYGSVLTLTGPSSQSVCEGDVMVLTCTHPPLDPPTYLPLVGLEMNGMDIPSISTPINSTASTLSVRVTRKGFQSGMMAMFGCVILQTGSNSTFTEVKAANKQ